eukprot:SAG31_NODE_37575_length_303_cov_0.750000_1_plen_42_part_01
MYDTIGPCPMRRRAEAYRYGLPGYEADAMLDATKFSMPAARG